MLLAGFIDITARHQSRTGKGTAAARSGAVQRRPGGIRLCRLARPEGAAARDRASRAMDQRGLGRPRARRRVENLGCCRAGWRGCSCCWTGCWTIRASGGSPRPTVEAGGHRRDGARHRRPAGAAAGFRRSHARAMPRAAHPPHADPGGAGEPDRQCIEAPRPRARAASPSPMRLADGVAEFRVSDDGPGIPPRFHDRDFRDLPDAGEPGRCRIERHRAGDRQEAGAGPWRRIRVESAPPARGTTFVFTWQEAVP